jgi:hypothetical protein
MIMDALKMEYSGQSVISGNNNLLLAHPNNGAGISIKLPDHIHIIFKNFRIVLLGSFIEKMKASGKAIKFIWLGK